VWLEWQNTCFAKHKVLPKPKTTKGKEGRKEGESEFLVGRTLLHLMVF
jgi:hypothetical protein